MSFPEYIDINGFEYSKGAITPVKISLSTEYTFTVLINGSPYTEVACSGSDLEYFAIGHMLSNNIIKTIDDIREVIINEEKKELNIVTDMNEGMLERLLSVKFIASGCGQAGKVADTAIINTNLTTLEALTVINTMKDFLHYSNEHKVAHGTHSCALYYVKGEKIAYFEDIGRHNAVDKSIGFALKNSLDLKDKMIVSTGRISSEIVHKSINAGIPVIISRSSTTSLGYELALKHNVILIGRVKASSFIIYNGKNFIINDKL
jgi:FdhD protein